jgi:hypothetical protein
MNTVSPSFHSPLCRSSVRGVDATVKFATAAPDGVKRSSGSEIRPARLRAVVASHEVADELPRWLVNAAIDVEDPGGLQRIIQPLERTHPRHYQGPDVPLLEQRPTIG